MPAAAAADRAPATAVRLVGAGVVGLVLAPGAAVAVAGALYGGVGAALLTVAAVAGAGGAVLGGLHRGTGGTGSSLRWGLGVALAALLLCAATAAAWQASGREFGREPLLWWAAAGLGSALVAAVGTRRTRVPAGMVVAVLLALSVQQLAPALPSPPPQRGCIAGSLEEAERTCP